MNRVDEGVVQVGRQISCRQEWQECEVAGTYRYKLATWKFYYCLKWSCYLQNIFVNPCEFLGLCWVVFRSRNFADAKRKEVACITLGFFPNSASGNGIWALGSGISKKNGLGNGTGTPPFRTLDVASLHHLWYLANGFGTIEALTRDKICSFCYPFLTTDLSSCPWFKFPNSLIIHIENSKKINALWKSDEKLLIFAAFIISPFKITFVWEVISSIPHSVSLPDDRMKHLKVRRKYSAARRIFSKDFLSANWLAISKIW